MAPCHVEQLLGLLTAIENGAVEWPEQLLHGFVCAVSKQNGRSGADGCRPMPLAGGMADVVKAFNGLPRTPQVKRRFLMGEAISEAVVSTSGFIEGDPLSVTAMSVASIPVACSAKVPGPCQAEVGCCHNQVLANGVSRSGLMLAF